MVAPAIMRTVEARAVDMTRVATGALRAPPRKADTDRGAKSMAIMQRAAIVRPASAIGKPDEEGRSTMMREETRHCPGPLLS